KKLPKEEQAAARAKLKEENDKKKAALHEQRVELVKEIDAQDDAERAQRKGRFSFFNKVKKETPATASTEVPTSREPSAAAVPAETPVVPVAEQPVAAPAEKTETSAAKETPASAAEQPKKE
ncbi:MAG: hypothetical protein PHF83_06180, partial [Candidatus Methanomethylophilus sp.]|nr:hypothetical protein [Methanomethylophilus sp.]